MKYAIVESGGKQYKAVEGLSIEVDLLQVQAGDEITLDAVMLYVDGDTIKVGTPVVKGASVKVKVEGHVKGPKVIVFKYRPKKRIRVKTGHRQQYTRLKIESITVE
ncbi:MAG TPA: 50S ribosomal protein L21 [Bellilinea sp.]|jgi:large subunit ribosomal protein L21|nr:50S ribosomal protein L21 [Bellilinea sp.]